MKRIVLIPAYEPSSKMIKLLKDLKESNLDIVVINDGSNSKFDKIFKEAKEYGIVLKHVVNMGKGVAIKTGLKYIEDQIKKDYVVITVDCDGQHSVLDTLNLLNICENNPDDLILGKRLRDVKIPLRSRFGNSITRLIYRITTGLDVYDTQSGLRAFSENLVPFMLEIEGERFEYEMNVLLKCPSNNIKIREVDIETIYIDNNSGSHFNPIKDSFDIYKEILKNLCTKK